MPVDIGTAQSVSWKTEPGKTVVLTVTNPDGTTATPDLTETSGTYAATVATTWAGRYLLSWTVASPADAYTDVLDVWPADPRFLISLEDARKACGFPATYTTVDDDLRLMIAAATPVIEELVGTVLLKEHVQTADGGRRAINLYQRPASADDVTQVKISGVVQAAGTYVVDPVAGIVYAGSSTAPGWFPAGRQNIEITYKAGSSVITPNLRLATSELVRHLWQVGHQGTRPAFGSDPGEEPTSSTPQGFAVPNRVIQLCRPERAKLPGFA